MSQLTVLDRWTRLCCCPRSPLALYHCHHSPSLSLPPSALSPSLSISSSLIFTHFHSSFFPSLSLFAVHLLLCCHREQYHYQLDNTNTNNIKVLCMFALVPIPPPTSCPTSSLLPLFLLSFLGLSISSPATLISSVRLSPLSIRCKSNWSVFLQPGRNVAEELFHSYGFN